LCRFWISVLARVVIRPSGTEPKVKAYLEVVQPVSYGMLSDARQQAASRLERLREATAELLARVMRETRTN
jgi:phosphomannomutase